MQEPFPDEVEVQYGLVNFRAIWGLPVGMCMALVFCGIAPLLWSRSKWWVTVLCVGTALVIGVLVKDDPQIASSWYGECSLKDYYD